MFFKSKNKSKKENTNKIESLDSFLEAELNKHNIEIISIKEDCLILKFKLSKNKNLKIRAHSFLNEPEYFSILDIYYNSYGSKFTHSITVEENDYYFPLLKNKICSIKEIKLKCLFLKNRFYNNAQ